MSESEYLVSNLPLSSSPSSTGDCSEDLCPSGSDSQMLSTTSASEVAADDDEVKIIPKKSKKSTYVRKYLFPRILKRDMRREFCNMLINVMNSGDGNSVHQFFSHYCIPTTSYCEYNLGATMLFKKPPIRAAGELSPLIDIMSHYACGIPDYTLTIDSCSIVQRDGVPGSKIVLKASFKGTLILPLFMAEDPCEKVLVAKLDEMSVQTKGRKKKQKISSSSSPFTSESSDSLPPPELPPPLLVKMATKPQMTFYFNESLQVFRYENIFSTQATDYQVMENPQ